MSCGVDHRCSSDPALLWLWCKLAATALIQPLARELPYATGVALRNLRIKKKNLIFKRASPARFQMLSEGTSLNVYLPTSLSNHVEKCNSIPEKFITYKCSQVQKKKISCLGDQDGRREGYGSHLLPKIYKNTSTCGTILTEYLLNKAERKITM